MEMCLHYSRLWTMEESFVTSVKTDSHCDTKELFKWRKVIKWQHAYLFGEFTQISVADAKSYLSEPTAYMSVVHNRGVARIFFH